MNIRRLTFRLGFSCSIALVCTSAVYAIDIETVLVGNAGNAADTRTMNDGSSGYGDVAYEYRIGKYEISNEQYIEFLRDVASGTDPNAVYDMFMGTQAQGGILRTGPEGNYTYSLKTNMGSKPVTYVSFWDAARFANWMQNGQPSGAQTSATTENGSYTLNGQVGQSGAAIARNPGAGWFIPNDDEWYKAAYYDPRDTAQGGPSGNDHYWLYATKNDAAPTAATATASGAVSNSGANTVNYLGSANWNGTTTGNVTSVGTAGATSFYGTFDQSGNVAEFNERNAATGQTYRTIRSGGFTSNAHFVSAGERTWSLPASYTGDIGFRIASVLNPPGPIDEDPELAGDYNDDGAVNTADYVLWRKHLGTNTTLPNDLSPGSVMQVDYNIWRENFGETGSGSDASAPVPEPAGLALAALGITSLLSHDRLRRRGLVGAKR